MLNTTFNKLRESGACTEGYRKLAKSLGGVDKYGANTPIPLDEIIESNGIQDTIWTLRCTIEPSENLLIEFACLCAGHVLHFYEDKYPDDKRPRLAIEAARRCITDKSKTAASAAAAYAAASAAAADAADDDAAANAASAAYAAAANAAYAAASAAAASAAYAAAADAAAAAYDAAYDAEREWQAKTLLNLLERNGNSKQNL